MLCIILTLHNPTYKYDPIVNFQVRMVKWLATTSFIKDTVVSQLFLLTSYSTTLCVCSSVVSTSFLMIISFVMEKSLRSVRQMRYWAEDVWFEERKKIVPILIYLSLLFFWYLMSENQRCIKTTQKTYQLGSSLLY